jgi:hypothetical protein|tara:strand:+ start:12813 stop:13361 length:549 start_codon:yes stop_codon:yes gene_type:complete
MISIEKYKINELMGIIVVLLYYFVFTKKEFRSSYITSKFWLGISPSIVKMLIPLQILAAIGGLYWYFSMINNPPASGLLSYNLSNNKMYHIIVFMFLFGSILWPLSLLQNNLLENKTLIKSLFSCLGLFIAAIAGILAQAGSFEANNISPMALLGISLFNMTVVLNDGVGWSARLLYQTIYK